MAKGSNMPDGSCEEKADNTATGTVTMKHGPDKDSADRETGGMMKNGS